MNVKVAGVVAAFLLMTGPAWSLSIANQDETEHEVTVLHAGTEHKVKVGAGQSIAVERDRCAEGCSVTGKSGPTVMAQTGESLTIKDGQVAKQQ
jgi:hypothetical protein